MEPLARDYFVLQCLGGTNYGPHLKYFCSGYLHLVFCISLFGVDVGLEHNTGNDRYWMYSISDVGIHSKYGTNLEFLSNRISSIFRILN